MYYNEVIIRPIFVPEQAIERLKRIIKIISLKEYTVQLANNSFCFLFAKNSLNYGCKHWLFSTQSYYLNTNKQGTRLEQHLILRNMRIQGKHSCSFSKCYCIIYFPLGKWEGGKGGFCSFPFRQCTSGLQIITIICEYFPCIKREQLLVVIPPIKPSLQNEDLCLERKMVRKEEEEDRRCIHMFEHIFLQSETGSSFLKGNKKKNEKTKVFSCMII